MKQMKIPIQNFDLDGFITKTLDHISYFLFDGMDPSSVVTWVKKPGDAPNYGPEEGWDVLGELESGRKMVFVPFGMIDEDNDLFCADQASYSTKRDDADDDADDLEDEVWMKLGETDSIGYLVRIKDGYVIINSAVQGLGGCCGPQASIDLCKKCGLLDKPMANFVKQFVEF